LPRPIHPNFPKDCISISYKDPSIHARGHKEIARFHAINCVARVDTAPGVVIASVVVIFVLASAAGVWRVVTLVGAEGTDGGSAVNGRALSLCAFSQARRLERADGRCRS
ncbi:MAG: hypothetical protein ACREBC_16845, partial [Pyrinomonadaceae bacterium]